MSLSDNARKKMEEELLLVKGGGIYYDSARVKPSETVATLFIGLGGTGADILIREKNEVKRRMELPKDADGNIEADTPHNIGFLAFDTDQSTSQKTWGITSFDKYTEFCSLSVNGLSDVIMEVNKKVDIGDPVWSWYEKINASDASKGANGIRQVGRLLLFQNIDTVYRTICNKLAGIRKGGYTDVNIIVFTGISGGTGAGTFMDMAYILRHAARDVGIAEPVLMGYFVMPDVNLKNGGEAKSLQRNAFASLKDLDYWMRVNEHEERFICQYSSNLTVNADPLPPFNFCHMVSSQDLAGKALEYSDVISSLADNAFVYVAEEIGINNQANTAMAQNYNNINGYVEGIHKRAPFLACYRYLALGSSKLEIPYEEISTLLAARLFEKIKPILNIESNEERYKRDMRQLRWFPKSLVHDYMMHNVDSSPLATNSYTKKHIWNKDQRAMNNDAYNAVYNWLARKVQPSIKENRALFPNVEAGKFKARVYEWIRDSEHGPCYVARFLNQNHQYSVLPVLEKLAEHCDNIFATEQNKKKGMEEDLRNTWEEGSKALVKSKSHVNAYIDALKEWQDNEVNIFMYAEGANAIRDLYEILKGYYDNVLSKLCDVMEVMPGIFEKNLEEIIIRQKIARDTDKLDENMIIWPLDFEQEHAAEFREMIDNVCYSFLKKVSENVMQWVGSDLGEKGMIRNDADIPGFLSRFISEEFGSLLQIDMEEIIERKLSGSQTLEEWLKERLMKMVDSAVPMFRISPAHRNQIVSEASQFAICSVPNDCANINYAADTYLAKEGSNMQVKRSSETTRITISKIIAGIPLYAYDKIEELEKDYEKEFTSKGKHLLPEWQNTLPSPLHEAAWAPRYQCKNTKIRNNVMLEKYDKCFQNGIIIPYPKDIPTEARLYIAKEGNRFDNIQLSGTVQDKLEQLEELRRSIWNMETGTYISLKDMGKYKNLDDRHIMDNIRENALRFPKIISMIEEQSYILDNYEKIYLKLDDLIVFTYALHTGLVINEGGMVRLKRSTASPERIDLYNTFDEKSFEEYEAYMKFRTIMDSTRRNEIKTIRNELLKRVSTGDTNEKEELLVRIGVILTNYPESIGNVKHKRDKAPMSEWGKYDPIIEFYETVIDMSEKIEKRLK